MNIAEINLEEGMPTCDEAMDKLKSSLKLAKQSRYKCTIVIHGYGSSGKGGAIRLKARQWLNAQVRNGNLKAIVNGENFDILNGKARELRGKFPKLETLLRVTNHGVTVVEL